MMYALFRAGHSITLLLTGKTMLDEYCYKSHNNPVMWQ